MWYRSGVRVRLLAMLSIVAAMIFALSQAARAGDGRTSSLSWVRLQGAEACVATQTLARAVEERLGRNVFVSASTADVSVEGRIEKRPGGGFRSVITIHDGKGALLGTRQLERRDDACEAMNAELALVIAVMIDPDATMRPRDDGGTADAATAVTTGKSEEDGGSANVVVTPPPTATAVPTAVAALPPERDRWRVSAQADVAVSSGLAPHTTVGAGAEWMVLFPKVPLGLRGYANVFYPTTAASPAARATYDLLYVGGALCPVLRDTTVDLFVCAGPQIGGLRARDTAGGVKDGVLPLVNLVAEGRAAVRVFGPLEVSAGVAGVLPLARPSSAVHQPSILGFTADFGVGVSLWP